MWGTDNLPHILKKVPMSIYTHTKMEKINFNKDNIKKCYIDLIKQYGKDNTLYTFDYCSNYGIELNNSTIDAIQVDLYSGDVIFVYNANVSGEYDYIESFSMEDLIDFYNSLIDVIENED